LFSTKWDRESEENHDDQEVVTAEIPSQEPPEYKSLAHSFVVTSAINVKTQLIL